MSNEEQMRGLMADNQAFQREIAELQLQVLELSAQVEVMRDSLDAAKNGPEWYMDALPDQVAECDYDAISQIAKASLITQSSALLSHDNEVAAKALEEEANKLQDWHSNIAHHLRKSAAERRNRK